MKISIRKFLLINLLLAITLTTTLTAIGNYYLDQKDIQDHLNKFHRFKNNSADNHNNLARRVALDDFYIMLLTFPLSGILIWIIIGRGLTSLNRITKEVAHRAPSHLIPVNINDIPEEIKPLIDELNKLFYRLQEGFEREKRFAADAAHELRTPLAAIKTQAQVAINTNNIEEKNIAIKKLLVSVDRSTHIVQQLLLISKLVPENTELSELEVVNLTKVTREILAMLAPQAIDKQIELQFTHADPNVCIEGNSIAIGILVRNLVDNAIKYSHSKGKVNINVYNKREKSILEVQDNGPGIPESMYSRVFERFFRVLGNHSHGSGLGLSIVQQICKSYRGTITLGRANKKNGLVVTVSFPRVDELRSD